MKNLNPLYEFLTPQSLEVMALASDAETAPIAGTFIGSAGGTALGGIGGGGYGIYKGIKASNKSRGLRERNIIKNIIITSGTADECIDKLRQIGTERALKYATKVDENRNGKWKEKLISNINNKNMALNIAGGVGGGVGGAVLGGALGCIGGGFTGYGYGKMQQDQILNYLKQNYPSQAY